MALTSDSDAESPPRQPPSENEKEASPETLHSDDDDKAGKAPASPRGDMKMWAWLLIAASVFSAVFLFALDNTVVADVQADVIGDLGEADKLPWISASFPLGASAFNLIWGKLFGQFDAKWTFIVTIILFEAGSAVCGAAPTMDAFIVGRVICGLGGGGIYMGAMNIISLLTTIKERPSYLSFTGLCWGTGTVLGPVIGGAFADSSATWRWAFYINLCIGAVFAPVYLLLIPSIDPRKGATTLDRLRTIDYLGSLIFIGACVSGIMVIAFGGALYSWNSGQVIGLIVCTFVLWGIFAVQQAFCIFTNMEDRLFPVEFIKNWELDILFAQASSTITCAFVPIYFIPLFYEFVYGLSALDAGVHLLPFIFLMVASTIANGVIMGKTGWYMPWFLGGGLLIVAGSALLYTVDISTSDARVYGYSVLVGIGSGSISQASLSITQAKVAPEKVVAATQFVGFGQIGGIALALAIANCIFINLSTIGITHVLPNATTETVDLALSGAGGQFLASLAPDTRQSLLEEIVNAISKSYVMIIAAGSLTVILSLFMKRERLFVDAAAPPAA